MSDDQVKQLAGKFGIPEDQVLNVLAKQLPATVDHASPDVTLPHGA